MRGFRAGDVPRGERGERGHPAGGGLVLFIAVGALAAGLVFLYLWQGATLSGLRAERAEAILALEELERVRLDLVYQVERAYSLDEIARRARALGMVPFDEERTRYLIIGGGSH
mgnify:CR=1 FL=1